MPDWSWLGDEPQVRGGIFGNVQPRPYSENRCVVHNCPSSPLEHTPIPICFNHVHEIGTMYAAMHDVTFAGDPSRHDGYKEALAAQAEYRRDNGVVYYIRLNNHVKIGTSIDLKGRMNALYAMPDSLLATEHGSYELEARRHREFAPERIDKGRELFNPSPRLLAHINNLRVLAGQEPLDLAA